MTFGSAVVGIMKTLFTILRKAFMPNRKDLICSLLLSIPLYFLLGLSLIFLLPLVIVSVFIVFTLRRLWKLLIIYWTVKVMRKKTSKEWGRLKKMFK